MDFEVVVVEKVVVVVRVAVSSSIDVTKCTFCACADVIWMRRKKGRREDDEECKCSMSIYSPTSVNKCQHVHLVSN